MGKQALEYLRREGMYFGVERPSAVFLDLNLPRVDGWQVLVAISHDEQLRSIPVAYALGAKHYVGAFGERSVWGTRSVWGAGGGIAAENITVNGDQ
jgi:hypothetical protein